MPKISAPNSNAKFPLLLQLFSATFLLSAFTFGGGYVIVPLMKKKFVEKTGWISEEEMLNLVAIAQSAPGPIAVNASILAGHKVAGFPGAAVTLLGTILPPLITLSVASLFYTAFRDNAAVGAVFRGMQIGVAAVVLDVVYSMCRNIIKTRKIFPIALMACAFVLAFALKINVALVIVAGGTAGALNYWRERGKGEAGP